MKSWETFCDFDSFLYPLILTFTTRIRLCLYLNLDKKSCVPWGESLLHFLLFQFRKHSICIYVPVLVVTKENLCPEEKEENT